MVKKESNSLIKIKVDLRNLKYYVIRNMQGHKLVTNPDQDAQKAMDKVNKNITFHEIMT